MNVCAIVQMRLQSHVDHIERSFSDGRRFLVANHVSFADVCIYVFMLRLLRLGLNWQESHERVAAFVERMPSWEEWS